MSFSARNSIPKRQTVYITIVCKPFSQEFNLQTQNNLLEISIFSKTVQPGAGCNTKQPGDWWRPASACAIPTQKGIFVWYDRHFPLLRKQQHQQKRLKRTRGDCRINHPFEQHFARSKQWAHSCQSTCRENGKNNGSSRGLNDTGPTSK